MAQLYFKVGADYDKVIKLREEIAKLEEELKSFGKATPKKKVEELENSLSEAKKEFRELADEAAKSGATLKNTLSDLGKPLIALGGLAAVKDFIGQMVRVRGEFQEMETSISTLVGEDMKNKLLPQIKELAKVSPLTMTDIVGAEKMMLGFNIEAEKTTKYLKALSDVSMGSSQKFNSLTLAFSQMSATGRLMGQDLNQMINAGFNPLQQIAKTTGKSISTLKDEMSKGAISAEMVQQAFLDATSAGGKFYNMSENASKTINGQISMLEDAVDAVFNELGTASETFIVKAISGATTLVSNYETIGKVLASIVATYGAYKAAVLTATVVDTARLTVVKATAMGVKTNTAAVIAHTVATKAATVAQAAFNAVAKMNPYVLLATAVVGTATAIWAFSKRTTEAEREEQRLAERMEKTNKYFEDRQELIEKNLATATDELQAESKRKEAFAELKELMPSVFAQYKTEIELTEKKTEALKAFNEQLQVEKKLKTNSDYKDDMKALKNLQRLQTIIEQNNEKRRKGQAEVLTRNKEFVDLVKEVEPYWDGKSPIEDAIKNLSASVNNQMQSFRENANNAYESMLGTKNVSELQKDIKEYERLIEIAKKQGKQYIYIPNEDFSTSIKDLQERINKARAQVKSIQENSTKDYLADAKKNYENAQAKVKKIIADRNKRDIYPTESAYKKALEKARKEEEAALKAYKDVGGDPTKDKKTDSEADKKAKQDEKYRRIVEENHKKNLKQIRDNAIEVRQLEIDMMKDGTAKTLAQIDLDYEKERKAIEDWEEEIKQVKIDAKRKEFESNPANKNKVFDASTVDTTLTADESKLFSEKLNANIKSWSKRRNEVYANLQKKEEEANAEYIRKFGTFLEQKEQLWRDHQERLAQIQKEGGGANATKLANAEYEAAIEELKEKFGVTTSSFVDLFEDASEKSVRSIKKIIDKYQGLIDILKNKKGEPITPEELQNLDLSEKQIKEITEGKVSLKDLLDAFKSLKRELQGKSPFESFVSGLKKGVDEIKNSNGDLEKIGNGIANIGQNVTAFVPALSEFSSNIASIFGFDDAAIQDALGAVEGLGETASGIGQMISGDIVGGLMTAVKGIANVVKSVKSLSDRDNEKRIQEYEEQIKGLEKEYGVLGKAIEDAYSYDASNLYEEQNKLLEQQKKLIEQQKAEEESKKSADKDKLTDYEERLDAINEKIEENKEKAIDAVYGEDLKSAIERFATSYANAVASGTSKWDSAKQFVKDTVKAMVVESIKGAIAQSQAIEKIREKLKEFMTDGLTAQEEAIITDMTHKAMSEIEELYGWTDKFFTEDDTTTQEATRKGISSLTQEQGEKLDGRFTAVQLATERTANAIELQAKEITMLNVTADDLRSISRNIHNSIASIDETIALSYLELQGINANTASSVKALSRIEDKLDGIKKNTDSLK